jgi:hypothetical protein
MPCPAKRVSGMTVNQSRLLGVAVLVSLVSLAMHLVRENARARLAAGAYVARTRQLSEHQTLVEIVIPEAYSQELDTRCIVYQNAELASSTMDCAGPLFRRGP